jgi:hypothetical protein
MGVTKTVGKAVAPVLIELVVDALKKKITGKGSGRETIN